MASSLTHQSSPTDPGVLPYGSWPSPIDTELLTSGSVGLSSPTTDEHAAGTDLYWLESRPSEKGRTVLVRSSGQVGDAVEVTPAPFNVRSSVHEYGGGAYAVADGVVVFSNFTDGRVYLIDGPGDARPISPDLPDRLLRYADLELDLPRRRVLAVREDHRDVGDPDGPAQCVNTIVALELDPHDPDDNEGVVLVSGHDFVAAPRLSPDGERLAFHSWEYPSMPWDSGVLWRGDADAAGAQQVAGGPGVSIAEIGWLADGRLAWCSDASGFWNLHVDGHNIYPIDADCADPAWVFGLRGWVQTADGAVLLRRHEIAGVTLVRLTRPSDDSSAEYSANVLPVELAAVGNVAADGNALLTVAGFRDRPLALVRIDARSGELSEVASSISEVVDPEYFSIAEPISWPTPDGMVAHGFYYPPVNPRAVADPAERPPLIVLSHGGPTGAASPALALSLQFWTSRGFAILDVNYGGSTGYGRAYRERLKGNWGIVDVDDCCSGAAYLVAADKVDGTRLAIRGGSAGGYTTLASLAFRSVFAAGLSRYGVGDLEALATDTHKFEARYLDGLIGDYPAQRQVYRDRSPIHHVDQLDCALLLLQGTEDKVVPPSQAISMADAVRAKGRPVALRLYDGEGHGFRTADAVRDAIEVELAFCGRVFGFEPDDDLPMVDIDNLPRP